MINRAYLKSVGSPEEVSAAIESAGLTLSSEGGGGRFFGVERVGRTIVVYLPDDMTSGEETTVRTAVAPDPYE
jgi:hypothetical protein